MQQSAKALTIILALVTVALGAPALAVGSVTTSSADVCPSGCAYSTVQAAIDAAAPGDTITIAAGTYTGNLVVAKDGLTIRGADRDGVVIDARAAKTYGIRVAANDVTLESFTLLGPNTVNLYGIHAARAPDFVHGLTIWDVTVKGSLRSEIDLHGARDALVANVAALGEGTGGVGLALSDSHDVIVHNLETSGNAWGGMAVYTSGLYVPGGSDNITVTGTNSFGELDALYTQTHRGHAITNVHVDGQFAFTLLDGGFPTYTWYTRDVAGAEALIASTDHRPTWDASVIRTLDASRYHVLDGMRIGNAVDAAAEGAIVHVAAGTFPESVTLDRKITLTGAGSGPDPANATIIDATGHPAGLELAAGTGDARLLVEHLRVTGATRDGVRATGSTHHVTLDDVASVANGRTGFNVGYVAEVRDLHVTGSHFDANDIGLSSWMNGLGTSPAFEDVVFEDTTFNDNGIKGVYVERLSNARFERVHVLASGVDPTYAWNTGIDVNLKRGDYENIAFVDTTVRGVAEGAPVEETAPVGITVKARDDGSYASLPATLTGVLFDGVTVTGNPNGIRLGEPGRANAGPTDVVVRYSDLSGNAGYGLIDETAQGGADARFNWWGTPLGPALPTGLGPDADGALTLAPVRGSAVAGTSTVAPWCVTPECGLNRELAAVLDDA